MQLSISNIPVQAQSRSLIGSEFKKVKIWIEHEGAVLIVKEKTGSYTIEQAEDLQIVHGIDIEKEMMDMLMEMFK